MLRTRLISISLLTLVLFATAGYTLSQAWYYRGASYRQLCADYLSDALQLPAEVGRVIPRSRTAQEFADITVWLPERRDRIFTTPRALAVQQSDDPNRYDIQVFGGMAEISTRTWLRSDYRGVLESGLRHGLVTNAVGQLRFSGMDLRFDTGVYDLALSGAGGAVTFHPDSTGHAAVLCHELNGQAVLDDPVVCEARFSMPPSGVQIDRLQVTLPRVPIEQLRLEKLIGVVPSQGSFSGQLALREFDQHRELILSGMGTNLSLTDLTRGLLPTPLNGSCPRLEVTKLALIDGQVERLEVRGLLDDIDLAEPFALANLPEIAGQVSLKLRRAELSTSGVDLLVATGEGHDLDLGDLTRSWGWGTVSGRTQIEIEDLLIRNNRIDVLVARCSVAADEPAEQWIDSSVLRALVDSVLPVSLPEWVPLPKRVGYERLSFRIEIRDEQLYLLGGHGPSERTILTVRLLGQALPLIKQPDTPINLSPFLDSMRDEMQRRLMAHQLRAATHMALE